MTLEAIKEAITELPDAERISLIDWLNRQDANTWDRQIEADFSEGYSVCNFLSSLSQFALDQLAQRFPVHALSGQLGVGGFHDGSHLFGGSGTGFGDSR